MDVYQRRRLVALSAVAVVFIVLVLLLRSCGGDEEPAPVTPLSGATGLSGVALTADDYIAQADPICLEANTALAAVDDADAEAAATEKGQILNNELASLQTLTLAPGEDGEDKLAKFLGAIEDQIIDYRDLVTASEREDTAGVAELDTAADAAAAEAAKAARNFGFEVCGDPEQVGEATETGTEEEGEADATDVATDTAAATDTVTEAPAAPVTPAPETTEPVEPAPTDTGGGTAPVAPAPTDTGSGGVTP